MVGVVLFRNVGTLYHTMWMITADDCIMGLWLKTPNQVQANQIEAS